MTNDGCHDDDDDDDDAYQSKLPLTNMVVVRMMMSLKMRIIT